VLCVLCTVGRLQVTVAAVDHTVWCVCVCVCLCVCVCACVCVHVCVCVCVCACVCALVFHACMCVFVFGVRETIRRDTYKKKTPDWGAPCVSLLNLSGGLLKPMDMLR